MRAPSCRRVPCKVCGWVGIVRTMDGTCQPCDRWATRCMRAGAPMRDCPRCGQAQAPIYDPTDYEHHCVGGSAGSQPCQCNPHAKHVQLTYARSERPGEQVRPGTSYYTAHVVLRHEATATLWVFASPDDFAARHEAQRWAQDTGVRHTVVVCTLIVTLPEVGALDTAKVRDPIADDGTRWDVDPWLLGGAVVPEVGTEEVL